MGGNFSPATIKLVKAGSASNEQVQDLVLGLCSLSLSSISNMLKE